MSISCVTEKRTFTKSVMNRYDVHLLDLPDEMLLLILKKLSNLDVLYSLLNINNERLDTLAQEKLFSDTLDFGSINDNSPTDQSKINRFCVDILPRIHDNVQCLVVKLVLMERILLAADYPNLASLKLLDFTEETISSHLTSK